MGDFKNQSVNYGNFKSNSNFDTKVSSSSYVYSNSSYITSTNVEEVDFDSNTTEPSEYDSISNEKFNAAYMKQYGDVNGDGEVNGADASYIQNHLTNNVDLADGRGDINGDGKVSIEDATIIQQYLAGNDINAKKFVSDSGRSVDLSDTKSKSSKQYSYSDVDIPDEDIKFINAQENKYDYYDEFMKRFADFNKDGKVDTNDVKYLINKLNDGTTDMELDLNADGKVDIEDARIVNKYLKGANNPFMSASMLPDGYVDDLMLKNYDLNKDGKVDKDDITKMKNIIDGDVKGKFKDINGDGKYDKNDVDIISSYIEGKDVGDKIDYSLKTPYVKQALETKLNTSEMMQKRISKELSKQKYAEPTTDDLAQPGAKEKYEKINKEKTSLENLSAKMSPNGGKSGIENIWDHITSMFHDGKYDYNKLVLDDNDRAILQGLEKTIKKYDDDIEKMENLINAICNSANYRGRLQDQKRDQLYLPQLRSELEELKEKRSQVENYAYSLKETIRKRPWYSILDTKDYKEWRKSKKKSDFKKPWAHTDKTFAGPNVGNVGNTTYENGQQKLYESYDYLSDDQLALYYYIYETKGLDEANKYLNGIQDEINQADGAVRAAAFLDGLDWNDYDKLEDNLKNIFCTSGQGLGDGIGTFLEGISNAVQHNEVLSPEDYKKMIILTTLKEKSRILDKVYEGSSAIGNMVLPMAASAVVSALATPAAGRITGSVLMGISAFGNAKRQSYSSGHCTASSWLYAMGTGFSETITDYFLSGIPYIGKESKSVLKSMFKEGLQECVQEYLDAGYRYLIFGEKIDLDKLGEDAFHSFVMGAVVSGIMNGGVKTIKIAVGGVGYVVSTAKLQAAIAKGEKITKNNISNYVDEKTLDPSVKDIMKKHNVDSGIAQLMFENNVDKETAKIMYKMNIDAEMAKNMISYEEKFKNMNSKERSAFIQNLDEETAMNFLSYFDLKKNNRYFKMVITRMTTEQMQHVFDSDSLSPELSKRISNALTVVFDKSGKDAFAADFKVIAENYMNTHDVPQMKSFIDAIKGNSWYQNPKNCPDGKIEMWAMIHCLQAQKLANNPSVDFLNTVNEAYGAHHKGADGKLDHKKFDNPIDAYFAVLNDCREHRSVLGNEKWKLNNKKAYLKKNPGAKVWTQEEIDDYYDKHKWLSDLTVKIAKGNSSDPLPITSFSSMQFSDSFILDGDVGRPGNVSTEVDGGMAGCDAYEVDNWILSTLDKVFTDDIDSTTAIKLFIDEYVSYASLKRSQWKTINRAVVSDASGKVQCTDGLSSNCFDLDWALGGETLGMNQEYFLEHGEVTSRKKISKRIKEFTAKTNYDNHKSETYHVTYAYGLDGILEEMYNSGRLSKENRQKVADMYKRITGKHITLFDSTK